MVMVIGHTTYDQGHSSGGGPSFGRCVALTHQPLGQALPDAKAWTGDLHELAARLKAESTETIWLVGGGRAAHSSCRSAWSTSWASTSFPSCWEPADHCSFPDASTACNC
jgi:hypothetical protein